MSSKLELEELEREESNTTHLPLPCGHGFLERYRKVQHEMHQKNKKPLHEYSRKRLKELLAELEQLLVAG